MEPKDACEWASRILNHKKPAEEILFATAAFTIHKRLRRYRIPITVVMYPTSVPKLMVITQHAPHEGWKAGDDPTKLQQFKMGKREEQTKTALNSLGFHEIEFVTSHGQLYR